MPPKKKGVKKRGSERGFNGDNKRNLVEQTVQSIKDKLDKDIDTAVDAAIEDLRLQYDKLLSGMCPIFLSQEFPDALLDNFSKISSACNPEEISCTTFQNPSKKVTFCPSHSTSSTNSSGVDPQLPSGSGYKSSTAPTITAGLPREQLKLPQSNDSNLSPELEGLLTVLDPAFSLPQLTIPTLDGKVMRLVPDNSFSEIDQVQIDDSTKAGLVKIRNTINKVLDDNQGKKT